jgi:hypothetical protein
LVEKLTGAADEGASRGVFLVAGPLADQDERRVGVAFAEDDVAPLLCEVACDALGSARGELV